MFKTVVNSSVSASFIVPVEGTSKFKLIAICLQNSESSLVSSSSFAEIYEKIGQKTESMQCHILFGGGAMVRGLHGACALASQTGDLIPLPEALFLI